MLQYFRRSLVFTAYKTFNFLNKYILLLYVRTGTMGFFLRTFRKVTLAIINFKRKMPRRVLRSKNFLNSRYTAVKKSYRLWINRARYNTLLRGKSNVPVKLKKVTTLIARKRRRALRGSSRTFLAATGTHLTFKLSQNTVDVNAYLWWRLSTLINLYKKGAVRHTLRRRKATQMYKKVIKYLYITYWINSLRKLFFSANLRIGVRPKPVEVAVVVSPASALTASFIARYISVRLLQKFPLRKLVMNLTRQMLVAQDYAHIQGFKISCNGRFERRGRASHI